MVSVGIPTYNRPHSLVKCLEGVLAQTYANLEVIISDNASTDPEVGQVIEQFKLKDSRIRSIRQPVNIGGENNFSFVYNEAKGEYFMWMADDDYFEPNYIQTCVSYLQSHPDFYHVSGLSKYYDGDTLVDETGFPDIKSNSRFIRVFQYFLHVRKNGIFYGVFRFQTREQTPISNRIGSDWSFIGRQAYRGKLKVLTTTYYSRSLAGVSSNRDTMVRRWKLIGWKKHAFELFAIKHIILESFTELNHGLLKMVFRFLLAILLVFRFLFNSIQKRLNPRYY